MKRNLVLASTVAISMMFSGCATIIGGKTQQINVAGNGKKIDFSIDGQKYQTPAVVTLRRANANKIVKVTNAECAHDKVLPKQVDGMFFGNIIFGGLFGSTTDYANDSMWKYDDNVMLQCNK